MRHRPDRGSATVEMAIMMPAAAALVIAILVSGRFILAQQIADSAAYDAARSASLARTEAAAITQARTAAAASFANQGIRCSPLSITPITGGFRTPVGQPATVTVRVSCRVDLRDVVEIPGMPVTDYITLTSSFTSPLDSYRSRT